MALIALALVIVSLAMWRGWTLRQMLPSVALAWLAVLVILNFTSPGNGLAALLGVGVFGWAVGGGLAALVLGYAALLRRLRGMARRGTGDHLGLAAPLAVATPSATLATPPDPDAPLNDDELDRYARHIVLREIGGPGQRKLKQARVLVVGAGGLGAPVALYLAAAGVGRLTLADDDAVSLSNLQRQVLFRVGDIGASKAEMGAETLRALNPQIAITPLPRRIDANDEALIAAHDLVLDGSDSFASRQAVNAACVAAGTPLISGAIAQWEGQLTLLHPAAGGPCLHCLFPTAPAPGLAPSCAEAGVVGALPGVIGTMMALEAIKHLTGAGAGLRGHLVLFDGLYGENRRLRVAADPSCTVCGGHKELYKARGWR